MEPILQGPRLELQDGDSRRSYSCPIYTEACKGSIYLCTTGTIHIHWHGGQACDISYPDWWDAAWKQQRRDWLDRSVGVENGGKPLGMTRFTADKPFGGSPATHAGGFILNWFTGLSISTDIGWKTLVTRPANQYNHQITVQDGVYDSDTFPGDFSFNLQVMTQEPIKIPMGTPVASLWVIPDRTTPSVTYPASLEPSRFEAADSFYRHKSAGLKYAASVRACCPHGSTQPTPVGAVGS